MDSINLLFCGDFFAPNVERLKFSEDLTALIKDCDVCCCNFEAPLKSKEFISKSGPVLCQSDHAPCFLESNGFNVITLANNHIRDYGNEGVKKTLKGFKSSLLVGAGNKKQAYELRIKNVKGIQIGFLSFSHYEFGIVDEGCSDENYLGGAWINSSIVDELIRNAKDIVDFLFVLPHAGIEEIDLPLPEWRERYQHFILLGADAVIATHPHVPQGWEIVDGKYIFYSLGNFYFDMCSKSEYWNCSLGVLFEIKEKVLSLKRVYNLKSSLDKVEIHISEKIETHISDLNYQLNSRGYYWDSINKMAIECWYGIYEKYYTSLFNGITLKYGLFFFFKSIYRSILGKKRNGNLLLNLSRCESHRWIIVRALSELERNKR